MGEPEDTLRSLALHDEDVLRSVIAAGLDAPDTLAIDARTYALVRVAVLMCLDGSTASYQSAVALALAAGATAEDLFDTLKAVAALVGCARVVTAAAALATAIGYDIDAALEEYDTAVIRRP